LFNSENLNNKNLLGYILTILFLKANIIAPACSAAFPTTGSRIMLMNRTEIPSASDASWKQKKIVKQK